MAGAREKVFSRIIGSFSDAGSNCSADHDEEQQGYREVDGQR